VDEKLGLFTFLDIRRAEIGRCDSVPIDQIQFVQACAELSIDCPCI